MTLPGWHVEDCPSGQVLYTSPCGRVRVQDTRRRAPTRFNVLALVICPRSRQPSWMEVTAVGSARVAAAAAAQAVDDTKPHSSAASHASATPVS